MSIKSDIWIKRMSREHKLIDPFEEKLVRSVDDRRIIRCGRRATVMIAGSRATSSSVLAREVYYWPRNNTTPTEAV